MTTHGLSSWLWLLGGFVGATLLVALSVRLPKAVGLDGAADRFSADRAMRIVRRLCDDIGLRANGTPAQERAVEMLVGELRKVPGVEVEVQRVGGVHQYQRPPWPFPPFVYQTINVVARLEGRTPEALLLNAHYDTPTGSVGAGDDAMGVAAMIEVLRVLAVGPKLEHSIVVNLNGGEEIASLGAAGFLQHRFARDVRAYLYVDTGPRGKPVVIGAGPGNAWMLKEYTAAARSVATSVGGQDMMDSGLLPHSGDFLPLHEGGIVGIDIAAVDDFWSVHTNRDRPERIDTAALQLMGDNLLAGARRLASGALPGDVDRRSAVYYDVAGLFVLVYSARTARALALAVLGLTVLALVTAVRRRAFAVRQMLGALGRLLLLELAAVLAAILVAAVLGFVLHRPHGWFSSPAIAVWVFGASAVAAAMGILAWRRRRRPGEPELVAWAAALLFWALLLAVATWKNLGSGYLPLWWAGCLATGLIGALYAPKWRSVLWLVAFVPGAALVLGLTATIFPFVVADIGLVPAPVPLDMLVAVLVAFAVAMLAPAGLAVLGAPTRLGRASIAVAVIAVAGAAVAAVVNPYSVDRPKRITAAVVQRDGTSGLFLGSRDALPLGPALGNLPEAVPCKSGSPSILSPPFTFRMPAAPLSFDAPRIEVLSSVLDSSRDTRVVRLRVEAGGTGLQLSVPRARVRGWSLGRIPERSFDPARLLVVFVNAAPADRELTLELAGTAPVEVELVEVRGPSRAAEVQELGRRLPSWTALDAVEIWSVKKKI
jgi:hypothetical protein